MENEKPLAIAILDSTKHPFFMVPRFWIDSLMDAKCHYQQGTGVRRAPRIPNSFWKFTFVLWRGITNGNKKREHSASMRQFHVRADAAVKWTAAYSVSGLFSIEVGKCSNANDAEPTRFQYNVAATETEWECFITALNLTLENLKKVKDANHGNTGGFKVALAIAVDAERKLAGLKPANEAFLFDACAGKILDRWGRPIAKRDDKTGNFVALFYPPERHRQREGESNYDYALRIEPPKQKGESDEDYDRRMSSLMYIED